MTIQTCPVCHLWHSSSDTSLTACVAALKDALDAAHLRERAALGQATLARQSAHEMGDKLRAMMAGKTGATAK